MSPRVPEVEMLSTCGCGPGPPQVGPGPPRAYPDPRKLSAQLAAWEGSGVATCPTGASVPQEANPHAALNTGGEGVRCQGRAWAAL